MGHFAQFVTLTLFAVATCDQTNLAIINWTPYTLKQVESPTSYQMVSWNDAFPAEVPKVFADTVFVQLEHGLFIEEADDGGEVYFSLDDGTNNKIALKLSVDGSVVDGYDINLVAETDGVQANGPGTVNIGFLDGEGMWTPFVLAGDTGSYVGNSPPTDWMFQSLAHLGCRSLKDIVIPGAHNAGMSKIVNPAGGSASNTQCQELDILGQLEAGVRYFDIRPVLSHAHFYTGHYSKTNLAWFGACGQSIKEIIDNINDFTSSNNELIILSLSHAYDTDDNYQDFDDSQWSSLLHELYNGLNYRFETDSTDPLTRMPLSDFISDGPAVVVVVEDGTTEFLAELQFSGRGFFPGSAFPKTGDYSNEVDFDKVWAKQYNQFVEYIENEQSTSTDQVFQLWWTPTLPPASTLNPVDHISVHADYLNDRLASLVGAPADPEGQTISPFFWSQVMQTGLLPNIVMVDNVRENQYLVSLAQGVSRYNAGDVCLA